MCIVGSETTPIPFWVIILSVMARFMGWQLQEDDLQAEFNCVEGNFRHRISSRFLREHENGCTAEGLTARNIDSNIASKHPEHISVTTASLLAPAASLKMSSDIRATLGLRHLVISPHSQHREGIEGWPVGALDFCGWTEFAVAEFWPSTLGVLQIRILKPS